MKIINCLVVDDEPLAREIIETNISKIPNWKVLRSCVNAEEAYEALLDHQIDVIFLDIEMPVISGVDFLKSLKKPPLIIFTTAYSEYALKGFDLNIIDYLLKPTTFSRFFQAVEKVNDRLLEHDNTALKDIPVDPNYMFIKHNGKLIKVIFSDILYIKAEQEYSLLYTEKDQLLVSMHLKLIERILPKNLFLRAHRSYIVSVNRINSIYGNTLQIADNNQIPIGNKFKEDLLKRLNIK